MRDKDVTWDAPRGPVTLRKFPYLRRRGTCYIMEWARSSSCPDMIVLTGAWRVRGPGPLSVCCEVGVPVFIAVFVASRIACNPLQPLKGPVG